MQELTVTAAMGMPRGTYSPLFSPDGSLLRYEQDMDGASLTRRPAETHLWNVREERLVARLLGTNARWSADRQHLAFEQQGTVCLVLSCKSIVPRRQGVIC
jgi:hypothetical protein